MPGKNKNREENYRPYEDEEQFEDLIMPEKSREEAAGKGGVISFLGKAVLTIHVCLAVLAGLFLYKSGYLPNTYLAAACAALAATVLITLPFHLGKGTGARILGMIVSLLLCLVMGVGLRYMVKVNTALNKITTQPQEMSTFVVVVKADDPAQSMEDAAGYSFAVSRTEPAGRLDEFRTVLGHETGADDPMLVSYDSPADCASALLDGKTNAALYNEGYSATLEEMIEDYSEKVRVLYRFDLAQAVEEAAGKGGKGEGVRIPSVDKPFTVYISGIDVDGPITTTSRSDVNIIMAVNPDTHRILLTTTPRDYYVTIPGISGDMRDKLTHAGIYGIRSSMATLEKVYGIPLDYYVRVNFTSLITIVDALGGVDVYSEYSFTSRDCSFQAGMNHMNGEQALAFSRARYNFASGDNQRGKNQEAVLTAIINKVTSPEVLLHADDLIETAAGCTQTSVSRDEISSLVRRQLQEGAKWDIVSQAATGTGDSQPTFSMGSIKLYVMWPNEDVIESLSGKMKDLLEMNN
jgi:LCP family protein required for cell wall assembly